MRRRRSDYGSILLGSTDDGPRHQRVRVQLIIMLTVTLANLLGVVIAALLATFGIPGPSVLARQLWWITFVAVPIYVAVAFVVGTLVGTVWSVGSLRWAIDDRVPSARDARAVLTLPWRLTVVQAVLWFGGTLLLTTLYGLVVPELIPKVLLVVGLSAVVVCAISYQFTEFAMRPAAARAMSVGFRPRRRGRLRGRALLSWAVGSGVPIVGMFFVVFFGMFREETSKADIFVAITALCVTALFTGFLLTWLNMGAIVAPVRILRSSMERVANGDYTTEVVIFDATDIGELQAGFNSMTRGLAEREKLRDLFGRHVGRDVAAAALGREVSLGGSEQTVAVVFVDVIGSTTLAATRTPTEVVALLNEFFAIIVAAVEGNRGLVNKFEGDAVLAIFGAPIAHPDPAGGALRAAREIADLLPDRVPELRAGIGVSYGTVVAGNVGAIERFEYTVIGDPVNESARLSEVAKRDPRRPVAAARAVDAARGEEPECWEFTDAVVLRGRDEPTRLYAGVVGAPEQWRR